MKFSVGFYLLGVIFVAPFAHGTTATATRVFDKPGVRRLFVESPSAQEIGRRVLGKQNAVFVESKSDCGALVATGLRDDWQRLVARLTKDPHFERLAIELSRRIDRMLRSKNKADHRALAIDLQTGSSWIQFQGSSETYPLDRELEPNQFGWFGSSNIGIELLSTDETSEGEGSDLLLRPFLEFLQISDELAADLTDSKAWITYFTTHRKLAELIHMNLKSGQAELVESATRFAEGLYRVSPDTLNPREHFFFMPLEMQRGYRTFQTTRLALRAMIVSSKSPGKI